MISRRTLLLGGLLAPAGLALGLVKPAFAAQSEIYTNSVTGLAINGYDSVAYFTQDRHVEGVEAFEYVWKGAPWRFASAENRDLFMADPERYAPQYGGYCAYAMAVAQFATTVPEAWTVYDGKLYLNFSTGVRALWRKTPDEYIEHADRNWAGFFG